MAADFYLQIDGIKGESADSKHANWIECMSVNLSIHQPKSATASTGGGHTEICHSCIATWIYYKIMS